ARHHRGRCEGVWNVVMIAALCCARSGRFAVGNRGQHLQEPDNRKTARELRLIGASAPLRAAVVSPLSAARWLLVLIVAAGIYFFHGSLVPVLAALVIAFASWPLYRRLLAPVGGKRTWAASTAILSILAFLVIPISLAAKYA